VDALVGEAATPSVIESLNLRPEAYLFAPAHRVKEWAEVSQAHNVGYLGEFANTGAEITLGDDLRVQLEGYSTVEYLPIQVPTCVTLVDQMDISILKSDLDHAEDTGEFADHLMNPCITFGGLAAIVSGTTSAGYVLSESMQNELDGRGGARIRRYFAAVRALQLASSRVPGRLKVSGFGAAFLPDPTDGGASDDPVVVGADDGRVFVAEVRHNRFGQVEPAIAQIVVSSFAGRTPPGRTLDTLGLGSWDEGTAAALLARLGLTPPPALASTIGPSLG
jgi:hypothetical protein